MIEARTEGHVARIVLAAPERHNAMDRAGIEAFNAALDALPGDARVLVVTGRGRSFCSGAALVEVGGDWARNPLSALADRLEALALPTICGLNGGVYGGGVEIALACDFRVGVAGMRMVVPAAELGLHYPSEGLARAVRVLGPAVARRMFLAAERFEAGQLLSLGFVEALVPPEALERALELRAERLAALAPLAVQGMKRTLWELGQGTLDPQAVEARVAACYASADHVEGLVAKREKRPPVFRGR